MRGYQFLKNDFFNTCRIRRITKLPMLLLIYLRGLYAYYGRPTFFYKDEFIIRDLGITKNTLRQARKHLRERGVISFFTFAGRAKATRYLILETELAPDLKGSKYDRKESNPDHFPKHEKGEKLTPITNKEIKPLNYGFSTKGNIEPEVEELLKKFKASLR